jgi:hypothetical protein
VTTRDALPVISRSCNGTSLMLILAGPVSSVHWLFALAVTLIAIGVVLLAAQRWRRRAEFARAVMPGRSIGLVWFGLADSVRRMHQLEDGLGVRPVSLKLSEAEVAVGICDGPPDPNYWHTKLPIGPRRMVEMIEESAFYTADLTERSGNILRVFALFGVALCVVSLIVASR